MVAEGVTPKSVLDIAVLSFQRVLIVSNVSRAAAHKIRFTNVIASAMIVPGPASMYKRPIDVSGLSSESGVAQNLLRCGMIQRLGGRTHLMGLGFSAMAS
jgi:hypothetical protein